MCKDFNNLLWILQKPESFPTSGNILVNRLVGANMYIGGYSKPLKDDKPFDSMMRQMTAIQTKLR